MKPLLAATSVTRSPRCYGHFFCPPGQTVIHFLVKKKKRKYGHPLVRPNFFGPIGDRINGVPLYVCGEKSTNYETLMSQSITSLNMTLHPRAIVKLYRGI